MRSFMKERNLQLIEEELERTIDRVWGGPESRKFYCQNPTLKLLLDKKTRLAAMREYMNRCR